MALMQLGMKVALENGFVPLIPPTLVKPEIMQGTGFLGEHSAEVYHLGEDDLYLTGTSEVALAGYHSDEIIDLTKGPLRYVGLSTCYRREAGSYGKDTRGIIRVHQFQKLEMFSYIDPADAEAEHERLVSWQEQMLQSLGLAYRVIDVAAEISEPVLPGSMTWRPGSPANLPIGSSPRPRTAPPSSPGA
jgi:seryl-tRNA synthetase